MTTDLLLIGRVARAHGIRGQVIVNPDTDFAEERFTVGAMLLIGAADHPDAREIREVRFHQGRPILLLAGVDTMDAAAALAGAELWMPAGSLAPLPEGTFYRHDLIGCDVLDLEGVRIGGVIGVEGTLERSLLIVDATDGEAMIPMVAGICVHVDLPARRIVVNPLPGLLEVNARKAGPVQQ
jgi:16S rRNA processing protein RimM